MTEKEGRTDMWYVILGILLLFFASCIFLASYVVNGKRQTFEEALKWQSERYDTSFYDEAEKKDYTVQGDEGYLLHVQLLKAPQESSRYVIITHGFTDNRMGALKYARFYRELGFNCVIYDIRGHGENEKTFTTYGKKEGKDLALLIEDTRNRYPDLTVLGLHGESLGAASTIMSLRYRPQVDFAVADCGFSDIENVLRNGIKNLKMPGFLTDMQNIGLMIGYGCSFRDMRPIEALADSEVPVMFIHGADDTLIVPKNSQDMYDAAKGYREIHLIPGAEHALSAIVAPEQYLVYIWGFLEKVLGN
ncbi:MAG: alpha/beta hydrolase [Oscillospiraceae bacterium]|nr:alpha/beta hydrolase [Oscillospiraceae bacterium]